MPPISSSVRRDARWRLARSNAELEGFQTWQLSHQVVHARKVLRIPTERRFRKSTSPNNSRRNGLKTGCGGCGNAVRAGWSGEQTQSEIVVGEPVRLIQQILEDKVSLESGLVPLNVLTQELY